MRRTQIPGGTDLSLHYEGAIEKESHKAALRVKGYNCLKLSNETKE